MKEERQGTRAEIGEGQTLSIDPVRSYCKSSKPFHFYYSCDWKQFKGFKQRSNRIWSKFKQMTSCSVEKGF